MPDTGPSNPLPGIQSYGPGGLANFAIKAGWSGANVITAVAVAEAESSGNPQAIHSNSNGSTDYGLWQVNSVHGYDSNKLITDPQYNADAAYAIWKGSGWGAWTTYTSGAYKKFLADGQKGANNPTVGGKGITSDIPGASTVKSWGDAVKDFIGDLTNGSLWQRIGIGAAAVVILLIAFGLIFRRDIAGAAKGAVGLA